MGNRITLKVGEIKLTVEAEERELSQINQVLLQALEKLAKRLEKSPFSRSVNSKNLVHDYLKVNSFTVQELLSASGAERLADDLYKQLVGGRSW